MAERKQPITVQKQPITVQKQAKGAQRQLSAARSQALFSKENYKWMLIGIVVMILGLILMAGGKSKDPNQFNPKEVYSFTRVTLAPILILAGFVLEIFAIFRNPKGKAE